MTRRLRKDSLHVTDISSASVNNGHERISHKGLKMIIDADEAAAIALALPEEKRHDRQHSANPNCSGLTVSISDTGLILPGSFALRGRKKWR